MKVKRNEVYKAIDSERAYQDGQWPQGEWDGTGQQPSNPLTIGEFLLLAEEYCQRARDAWSKEKKPEGNTLEIIRKIAGIVVNCMEQHGAPQRKGFEMNSNSSVAVECPDCCADLKIENDKLIFVKHKC